MEWANRKKKIIAILTAIGFSLIPIGLTVISVLFFQTVPINISPPELCEPVYGKQIRSESSSDGMDPALRDTTKFLYIADAICKEELKNGDRIVRIAIGKKYDYWAKMLDQMKAENRLLWKEAGQHEDYRSLYIGPIKPEETSKEFMQRYSLANLDSVLVNLIIEKVHFDFKEEKLTLTFENFWPLHSTDQITDKSD